MKKSSTLFLALLVALSAIKGFGFSWTVNGSSATNTGGRNYAITLPAGTTSANVVCDPTGVSGDHTYMRYTFNNSLALADVPGWWTVPQNQPQTYWTGDGSWEWRPPQTMTKTISGFGSGSWRVIVEGENYNWTQSYVLTVTVPGSNIAPTITWVQNPASANVNQWFTVQARGNDANGNLSNVWVWKDWVPFAFNGGGNGWESYSDANSTVNSSPGSTTFQAQSADSAGASSAVIYHTVTINSSNQQPSVTMQLLNAAKTPLSINGNGRAEITQNQNFYIRVTGTDPDGNLSQLYSRINTPSGSAFAYEQVGASGATAVHDFGPYTASQLGVWDAWAHATDTTAGAYQWQGGGWWGTHSPDLEVVSSGLDPLADNDDDGMPNGWEQTYGLNPQSAADSQFDPDNDGLTNVAEYNLGKNPQVYDQGTSGMGNAIPGGWPNSPGGANYTANLAVGATAGELNVDKSGAATYSVPIWTTPGTAGMQPQISLGYSSQAGAGVAGFGWSLGGVSAISRGPTSMAVDAYVDGVDFDNNDQYYLDGQRLIYIGGGSGHGTNGAEYRTELETFTKVVAYGTRGLGPARFKAQTKAGLIIWFGNADSDSTNDGSTFDAWGHPEPFTWNVSRIQDTKGNYMNFTYDEVVNAGEGSHRLTRIDYTGNGVVSPYASLRFEYEDRPDWSQGYSAGCPVSNLKRLKYIRSYFGESIARTYTLSYTNRTTANSRSILTTITEAGADGIAYPGLTFEYEDPTGGWEQASYYTPSALAHLDYNILLGAGLMDLNGDGYTDFVRKKTSNSGVVSNDAWLNQPNGWTATPGSGLPDYRIIGDAMGLAYEGRKDPGTRMIDINGDGLVDVIFSLRNSNGTVTNYLAVNNGAGWSENSVWTIPTYTTYPSGTVYLTRGDGEDWGRRLLDINGDGLPDLIWNFDNSEVGCLINNIDGRYQSGGPAWVRADQWAPPLPISGNVSSGSQFFDVNGDGLPDQIQHGISNGIEAGVAINSGTGWLTWHRVNFSGGTPFATYQAMLSASVRKYLPPALIGKDGSGYRSSTIGSEVVDLNADGLADIIMSNPKLGGSQGARQAWLNTGGGWVASAEYTPPYGVDLLGRATGYDTDPTGAVLTDLNGDGLPDLAAHRSDQTLQRYYYLNTGHGWGAYNTSYLAGVDLSLPHPLAHGTATTPTGTQFADLNGDGMADSVSSDSNNPYTQPWLNKAKPTADRLKKVTNGLGVAAQISYALLTERDGSGNPTIYTKGTGGPVGSVNITGPMVVAKAVTHDDGTAGQYEITYKYAGLRADRLRGSLGFEQMAVTDSRTAIRSETTFAQVFPFTGMPVSSKTISGTVTLKDTLVVYDQKLLNSGKSRFVFALDSDEISRDLNGATLGSTSTTILTPATDIDDYGNIKKIVVDTDGYTKTTDSVFTNDTGNWFLGRLTSATVTTTALGQSTQIRTSSFVYDPSSGLLTSETVQPGDAVLGLSTTYGYDQFGNKTSVSVAGSNLTVDANGNYSPSGTVSRTTTTQYDSYGRFPSWTKNALNHQENYTGYDQVKGVLTSMSGANGLATSWTYDGFGRKIQENRADGTLSKTTYRWVAGAPAQAKYLAGATVPTAKYHVETESTGAPPALAFYDAFGRAFLSLGVNGDGNIVYTTTHHDNMGRAFAASVPYLASSTAWWSRTTAYDLLNRPLTVITPDDANGDQTTSYSYNGLTVSVTDPKGRVARTVKNTQGWSIENTRNVNAIGGATASTVTYTYDVLGNLTYTDAAGVTTGLAYDGRGRKAGMTDADMGTWLYRYNVFGELIWQKDSKGQIVTMVYDQLGRLTSRVETEGTTNWTYDSSPTRGIGKLHTVTAPAGLASAAYTETYLYDNYGRPNQVTRSIDGTAYVTQTAYDSVGRVSRTIYPTSISGAMSTRNVYNDFGYLKEIRNWIASDDGRSNSQLQGKVYWMADSYAITGQINGETYGNGLANDRAYSAVTGRLYRATIDRGSVITAPFFVQDLNYAYDAMGNVKSRIDYTTGFNRDERFSDAYGNDGYDGLDRLKVHRIVGGATVTVDYNAKGNITNKSDVGGYTYYANRPHAVQVAGVNSDYTYDAVGNMLTGAGRTLEWTSFNQLKKVTQASKSSEFAFGAGHERVLQISRTSGTVTNRTVYVGGLYERVQSAGGLIEHKHYIMGPTGRIAVFTERSDLTKDTRWFHTDGLGSITVISDENGRVLKRHTYDAWGKQGTSYTNTGSGITNTAPSTRGYTDHEMLSDFGLIHMNGRVYDPTLGRFLSADPNVDGVSDAQGYNRYSYVGNNPMNATDPSGYFKLKDALKAVAAIVIVAVATIVSYGALTGQTMAAMSLAVGSQAGFVATCIGAAAASGNMVALAAVAIGGFAGGFAGSLLNGGSVGDAFKAGLIGGIVGFATAGIAGIDFDSFGEQLAWKVAAHGTVGGLSSELQGGSFRHGFYSSAASAGLTYSGAGKNLPGNKSIESRTIRAAVVGGTVSAIGGGKFANGAVTSAFQHLFNNETKPRRTLVLLEKGLSQETSGMNELKYGKSNRIPLPIRSPFTVGDRWRGGAIDLLLESGGKGIMTVETYENREQLTGALQLAGDYDSIWVSSHGGRSDTSEWFDVGGKNSTDVNAFKSELPVDVAQKIQFHHCDYVPNHSWVDGINNIRAENGLGAKSLNGYPVLKN